MNIMVLVMNVKGRKQRVPKTEIRELALFLSLIILTGSRLLLF